jgi:AcrR family transcriptional regulator
MLNDLPEPRKKPKQKRAQETVRAIIEATAHILEEEGVDQASTNRIAKRAGVSIGSLYQYFPNKESLYAAVVEQHCSEMLDLLRRSTLSLADAPLEVAVCTYVRTMLEAHSMNPKLHRVFSHDIVDVAWPLLKRVQRLACDVVQAFLELHRERIVPTDLRLAAFTLVMSVEGVTHAGIVQYEEEIELMSLESEICALVLGYLLGRESRNSGVVEGD